MSISVKEIAKYQKNVKNIRNICILAHVDHGKTTLSDSLLASNGIISQKLAGKVRYLDSREDEQERGITMESSGISLSFQVQTNIINNKEEVEIKKENYLINLIDSPGHVDFSSEVSTASRLSDGALVLIDVVEGICTQTHTVLRQAWTENVRCIIVFNKIDRLITELKLTSTEAYVHIKNILEQVNAIMGSFFAGGVMEEENINLEKNGKIEDTVWDEEKEKEVFFSPEKGNVIFASAIDGWAFRIGSFAKIYSKKLGIKESILNKVLWGDYYLDPKTKKVLGYKHLKGRNLKPMFVQFIFDNIWTIFESVEQGNKEKVEKIVKSLGLRILPRDLKSKDIRFVQANICSHWLPLASTVLYSIVEQLPSPLEAQPIRLPKLINPKDTNTKISENKSENQVKLEKALYSCDSSDDAPVVVVVSKMVNVPVEELPCNRRIQLTAEEMRENRRKLLLQKQNNNDKSSESINGGGSSSNISISSSNGEKGINMDKMAEPIKLDEVLKQQGENDNKENNKTGSIMIGFARIFSGTIREGQKIYVLGPKYDPSHPTKHCSVVTVENLYLIMGRELEALSEVPAGNVFGISGLQENVLKSATLSSYLECPNLINLKIEAPPIVRVAVEPKDPSEMRKLVEGLKLLNQADSCVEVLIQETGEHVIITAGELHLERCLKDLREKYAKIEIHASAPIVPFRETLSKLPALNSDPFQQYGDDDDDEEGTDDEYSDEETTENSKKNNKMMGNNKKSDLPTGTVIVRTPNKMCTLRLRAVPLPEAVTTFLVKKAETIKRIVENFDYKKRKQQRENKKLEKDNKNGNNDSNNDNDSDENKDYSEIDDEEEKTNYSVDEYENFIKELQNIFDESVKSSGNNDAIDGNKHFWDNIVEKIWAFGMKRVGPNILINNIPEYKRQQWCQPLESIKKESSQEQQQQHVLSVKDFDGSIISGFQIATNAGPLCAEPMMGVCFILEEFNLQIDEEMNDALHIGTLSGQIISTIKEACNRAFLEWSPRLSLATYFCEIQASTEVLGKLYGVLSKRHAKIIEEDLKEGTQFFQIKSLLPVIESFGFSDEIRKRTSGAASPQFIFHGYQILDEDPFWVPTTEEELEDIGEKADKENIAKKYMNEVRKRKGLFVDKKIVEHGEKQRTLSKKK